MRLMLASLSICAAAPAVAEPVLNRIASFPTIANMAEGEDPARESIGGPMAVTDDGNTLIYADRVLGAIGLIDITDPAAPAPLGNLDMQGGPIAPVVIGGTAFVAVNTIEISPEGGALRSVDIAAGAVTDSCDLDGQPTALARNADGTMLALAMEPARQDKGSDGPKPSGHVVTLPVTDGAVDCAGLTRIDLPVEPAEPRALAFSAAGDLAVALPDNNHLVIIGTDGAVTADFSAGTVDLDGIDTVEDDVIDPTGSLTGVDREPAAVAWLGDDHLVTANGESRGFAVWNRDGTVAYDSGNLLERELIKIGHYPEQRSENQGGEPHAVITATYGDTPMIFVAAERGGIVFAFDATDPAAPRLVQTIPSGIGPEGLVAIPGRDLFASANDTDKEGGARAHVMIFRREDGPPAYPMLTSDGSDPLIAWGALSGLTADPAKADTFYTISDAFYPDAPAIFTIDAAQIPARIIARTLVTRDGKVAGDLDLEGIAADGGGGFWLASEGDDDEDRPHAILHVDQAGAITQEIRLPDAVAANQKRFGFEGIELIDGKLWIAMQREWDDDPEGLVKLLQLDPATEEWRGVHYPIETGKGWVGLSALAAHDGGLYIVERDNQIGDLAVLKQITRVGLDSLNPAPLDGELPVVEKQVVRDLIPDLKGQGGYVVDKVEGLAITPEGRAWIMTDNDGNNDSSGETLFWVVDLD